MVLFEGVADMLAEATRLGLGEAVPVSAETGALMCICIYEIVCLPASQ